MGTAIYQPAEEGETIFQAQCAACHTIGGGPLVGPDLLGVTERRENDWLIRWIRERVEFLAPVLVYPGGFEMEALAMGALRVLRGEQTPRAYP